MNKINVFRSQFTGNSVILLKGYFCMPFYLYRYCLVILIIECLLFCDAFNKYSINDFRYR